jgi:hypothetical protein
MIETTEEAMVIVRSLIATKELLTKLVDNPENSDISEDMLPVVKRDIEVIDGLLHKILHSNE